jgi:hypothetical protein
MSLHQNRQYKRILSVIDLVSACDSSSTTSTSSLDVCNDLTQQHKNT